MRVGHCQAFILKSPLFEGFFLSAAGLGKINSGGPLRVRRRKKGALFMQLSSNRVMTLDMLICSHILNYSSQT